MVKVSVVSLLQSIESMHTETPETVNFAMNNEPSTINQLKN